MSAPYLKKEVIVVADAALYHPVAFPSRHFIHHVDIIGPNTTVDVYSRAFSSGSLAVTSITSNGATPTPKARVLFSEIHTLAVGDIITVAGSDVGGYNTQHTVSAVIDDNTVDTEENYSSDGAGGTATRHNILAIKSDGSSPTEKALISFDEKHKLEVGDTITVANNGEAGYNTTHEVTEVVDLSSVVTDQNYSADGAGGSGVLAIPATEQPSYEVIPQTTIVDNVGEYSNDHGELFVYKGNDKGDLISQGKLFFKFGAVGTFKIAITGRTGIEA